MTYLNPACSEKSKTGKYKEYVSCTISYELRYNHFMVRRYDTYVLWEVKTAGTWETYKLKLTFVKLLQLSFFK